MLIGFSSGTMHQTLSSSSPEFIDICLDIGCNAIEIHAATPEEVTQLKENISKIKDRLARFEHVSLHSPGIKFIYQNDQPTRDILDILQEAYNNFNCRCLVVHPGNVADWAIFDQYNFNIAVENMSNDVPFYSPGQLKPIYEKNPNCRFVLDAVHAYKFDQSPRLINELIAAFSDKLVEIHISGTSENIEHDLLFRTQQVEIIQAVPKNRPIIIESACNSIEDMRKELDYIKNNLES
jgi:hypothetical protein